jgi:aryl-alcohol dehydrogenase-like predicted oxidoreductase
VSALALGTAQFAPGYGVARQGAGDPQAVLEAARERGVRWLDTAPDYGEAEALIGRFMHARRAAFSICTKLPRLPAGLSGAELRARVGRALDASRRALGAERIECYLVHGQDDFAVYGAALAECLAAHCAAGRVGRFGASVYDPAQAAAALAQPACTALQYPFSVFDRRMRAACAAARLRFARSALVQGLLALDPAALPPRLQPAAAWLARFHAAAQAAGMSAIECALRFAFAASGADAVVIGVDTAAQLHAAADAAAAPADPRLAAVAGALEGAPAELFDPRRWPLAA